MQVAPQFNPDHSSANNVSEGYEAFCRYLETTCGITLGANKQYLVTSRLRTIMQDNNISDLNQLVSMSQASSVKKLSVQIVNAMTTNETSWFRDVYPFEFLKESIMPEWQSTSVTKPRIWSAACSYGHEPYSISIAIEEYLERNPGQLSGGVEIVGTDISTRVLEQARKGEFDDLNLSRGLSAERRQRFFTRNNHLSTLSEKIRERVNFYELNLLKGFATLGQFDLVFCRNVLIYFSNENKSRILSNIESAMKPGAWLFLGASEPIANYSDSFQMINCPRGVVYRKKR